jgi:hypothetical protein
VGRDGPVGEVEALADLLVGQARGGELGDLPVERSQQISSGTPHGPGRSRLGGPCGLAGGTQLVSGADLPRQRAEPPERIQRLG